MGLTAILSSDVLDIMSRDFYEKYEEYMSVMAERKNRQLSSGLKPYSTAVTVERHQLANFIEKAVQETAEWNKKMNQDRYVCFFLHVCICICILLSQIFYSDFQEIHIVRAELAQARHSSS